MRGGGINNQYSKLIGCLHVYVFVAYLLRKGWADLPNLSLLSPSGPGKSGRSRGGVNIYSTIF